MGYKTFAQGLRVKDAKEKWLETQLQAYLCLHRKVQLKHLGLDDKMIRQCIQRDSPSLFFEQKMSASACCVAQRSVSSA
jgi:hypothetical protein